MARDMPSLPGPGHDSVSLETAAVETIAVAAIPAAQRTMPAGHGVQDPGPGSFSATTPVIGPLLYDLGGLNRSIPVVLATRFGIVPAFIHTGPAPAGQA